MASYLNATRADVSIIKMHMEKLMNETYPSVNLIAEAQLTQLTQIQLNTANNVQVLTEFRDLFRRATTPGSGVKVNM